MNLRIRNKQHHKSSVGRHFPPVSEEALDQWLAVSLLALVLLFATCMRAYSQVASTNPGEYTILAAGNTLINKTVKSETKAERETALMQNAMAGEFTKMKKWERDYNSY